MSDLSFDSTSDIIFTLGNLDDYHVASISYKGYESAITKYVSIDTTNSNRIVTIKPAFFEVTPYVEGGIPLIVNLDSQLPNGKDVKVKVLIPYPNYSNELPLFSSYYSRFNSNEYLVTNNNFATSVEGETDLIQAINNSSIDWRLNNAKIDGTNSYDGDNDNCLTIKRDSNLRDGYAISGSLFANIRNLSFLMRSSDVSNAYLRISLLDTNKNVVGRTYEYSLKDVVSSNVWSYVNIILIEKEHTLFDLIFLEQIMIIK